MAGFVGAEGDEALGDGGDLADVLQDAVLLAHAEDAFRGVVAAQVDAVERGALVAAVDVSAGDGVPVFPAVGEDRRGEGPAFLAVLVRERFEAFVNAPAVVLAATDKGHFLDPVLSDVGDPQVAIGGIEAEPPRIAEARGPDLGRDAGLPHERVVARDGVGLAGVGAVDVETHHLAEEQTHVLGVSVGVIVRTGVAHGEVEETVRPEFHAATAVILGNALDEDQASARPARIAEEVGRELFLDEDGGHGAFLEDLVLQVVLPVLAELWMEGHSEEAVRPTFAEDFGGEVGEHRLRFPGRGLLHPPDHSLLVEHEEIVGPARDLVDAGQAGLDLSGAHAQILGEERFHTHGPCEDRDVPRHATVSGECGFRLLQGGQVFDEVRELLWGQPGLQRLGHQRDRRPGLRFDVGLRKGYQLPVAAHDLDLAGVRLLEHTLVLEPGLGLHNHGAVAGRDGGGRIQHGLHEVTAAELVADRLKVGTGLAGGTVDGMAVRAGEALGISEQCRAACGIAALGQRFAAVGLGTGWTLGHRRGGTRHEGQEGKGQRPGTACRDRTTFLQGGHV